MRTIEVLRRVMMIAGVLTAAAMTVWPAQAVWRVGPADFAKIQSRRIERFARDIQTIGREAGLAEAPKIESGAEGPLDDFVARETADRLHEVAGPAWSRLFDDVGATLSGKSRVLSDHLETDDNPGYLYFPLSTDPIAQLGDRIGDSQPFAYVRLADGDAARYLSVTFQRSGDAMRYAPSFVAYPWRAQAVWWFLAAMAAYCLIPRRRPEAMELRYSQIPAAIVPDWLGMVLTTVFAVLPILIIASNASSFRPWSLLDFEDGWGILTLVMGFMALGGIAILVAALWYATFSLFVQDTGIRRHTLLSNEHYPYDQIESVDTVTSTLPRWLKFVMLAAGALNPRMSGTMVLGATSSQSGIQLRLRDGRRVNIWFDHLNHAGFLVKKLAAQSIAIAPGVLEAASELDAAPPQADQSSTPGRWAVPVAWFVIVIAAALTMAYWPQPQRQIVPPQPRISPEIHARQSAILVEMTRLQKEMDAALAVVKNADAAARGDAVEAYGKLLERFRDLARQYDQLDTVKYESPSDP